MTPSPTLAAILGTLDACPHVVVVRWGDRSVRAGELAGRVRAVGAALRERGVGPGVRVGLSLPRSVALIEAMLGVRAAGGTWVALDPAWPAARRESVGSCAGIAMNVEAPVEAGVDGPPPAPADPVAYVVHTSGSSGRPKGAMLGDVGLLHLLRSVVERLELGPGRRVASTGSVAFDLWIVETLAPLLAGACVQGFDTEEVTDFARLAAGLRRADVDVVMALPAVLRGVLEAGWSVSRGAVAMSVGERMPLALVRALRAAGATPWNGYGPTETTIYAAIGEAGDEEPVPVGRPLPGVTVGVEAADATGLGEIVLGGPQVGLGYLGGDPGGFTTDGHYRTGDLGRMLPDGRLVVVGRADRQVKVRGERIELAEVEAALSGGGAAVAVEAVRAAGGEVSLVAFSDGEPEALSRRAAAALPAAAVPGRFLRVDPLPVGPTGKLDRAALRGLAAVADVEVAAPPPELAPWCAAFAEVFGLAGVAPEADFFALGGDSLAAVRLCAAVAARVGAERTVAEVLRLRTPSALAAAEAPSPVRALAPHELHPTEARFLAGWHRDPLDATDHLLLRVDLPPMDLDRVQRALSAVVARHEALRARFPDGMRREVGAPGPVEVEPWPLTTPPALEALESRARRAAFDLREGPPFRAYFAPVAGGARLVLVVHHVAFDGGSLAPFAADLAAALAGHPLGPPPPRPSVPAGAAGEAWWASRLAGLPEQPALPTRRPPVLANAATAVLLHVAPAAVARLDRGARAVGATRYAAFLAVLVEALGSATGEPELCVLAAAADPEQGRSGAVGAFVRMVPVRVARRASPVESLREAARAWAEALAHGDVPFERIVALSGHAGRPDGQPLARVLFQLRECPRRSVGGLAVEEVLPLGAVEAPLDLSVELWPEADGAVRGRLAARTGRFSSAEVTALAARFEAAWRGESASTEAPPLPSGLRGWSGPVPGPDGTTTLTGWAVLPSGAALARTPVGLDRLVAVPRLPLTDRGDVDVLALAGRRLGFVDPRTAVSLHRLAPALMPRPTLATAPASLAASAPGAPGITLGPPALVEGPPLCRRPGTLLDRLFTAAAAPIFTVDAQGARLRDTLGGLVERAGRVAGGLQACGVTPGQPVIVAEPEVGDALEALWGVVLAGAWPVLGGSRLYADALSRVAAAVGAEVALGPRAGGAVRWLTTAQLRTAASSTRPRPETAPFLGLLTSGTSGSPRVVPHSEAGLLAFCDAYSAAFGFGPDDRFVNVLGLEHAASILMTHLVAVSAGATQLHAPASVMLTAPLAWLGWMSELRATSTVAPEFAYARLLDALPAHPSGDLSAMRAMLHGGESVRARTCRDLVERLAPLGLQAAALVPGWGMSETASVAVCGRWTGSASDPVPLGAPLPGVSIRIVDAAGAVVGQGVAGELQVRGPAVFAGYAGEARRAADDWFATGDLAMLGQEGLLHLGRLGERLVTAGEKRAPMEVEAPVEALGFVAAAVPVRDPSGLDAVALVYEGPVGAVEAVRAAASRGLGGPPRWVVPVPAGALPRGVGGKLLRREVANRVASGGWDDALAEADERLSSAPADRTTPAVAWSRRWRPVRVPSGRTMPWRVVDARAADATAVERVLEAARGGEPTVVLTRLAADVPGEPISPRAAAVSALARSLAPAFGALRVADIRTDSDMADALANEPGLGELEVAWRGGVRLAPRLVAAPGPLPFGAGRSLRAGTVLLIGGHGVVGALLAPRLEARLGARVIALGRRDGVDARTTDADDLRAVAPRGIAAIVDLTRDADPEPWTELLPGPFWASVDQRAAAAANLARAAFTLGAPLVRVGSVLAWHGAAGLARYASADRAAAVSGPRWLSFTSFAGDAHPARGYLPMDADAAALWIVAALARPHVGWLVGLDAAAPAVAAELDLGLPVAASAPATTRPPSPGATVASAREAEVRRIWLRILGRPAVGLDEGFFAAGGHSISLVELHAALAAELGLGVPVAELFRHPTIRAQARLFGEDAPAPPDEVQVRAARQRALLLRGRQPHG